MEARRHKAKKVLARIEWLEAALVRAREYLATGKHAEWSRFRPAFAPKWKDGKELPPHRDWVKNVFIPHYEKTLGQAERVLERLENTDSPRVRTAAGDGWHHS